MRKKSRRAVAPLMLFQLAVNSGETIARRFWMMASGRASRAEYQRMVTEKVKAAQQMGAAMLSKDPSFTKLLKPWHAGARRNVKRLRKRKG